MLPLVPRRFAGWAAPLRAVSARVHSAGFMLNQRGFPPHVAPYRVVREAAVLTCELGLAGRMDMAELPASFVVVACLSRGFIVFSHSGNFLLPSLHWDGQAGWSSCREDGRNQCRSYVRTRSSVRNHSRDAAEIRASRRQAILWSAGRRLRSGLRGHALSKRQASADSRRPGSRFYPEPGTGFAL